jgi:hypothetical protein
METSVQSSGTHNLPRLFLDVVHCVRLVYEDLDIDLKNKARLVIASLRDADTTNPEKAEFILRGTTSDLLAIEAFLASSGRSLTANKVRRIRERMQHLTRAACTVP